MAWKGLGLAHAMGNSSRYFGIWDFFGNFLSFFLAIFGWIFFILRESASVWE